MCVTWTCVYNDPFWCKLFSPRHRLIRRFTSRFRLSLQASLPVLHIFSGTTSQVFVNYAFLSSAVLAFPSCSWYQFYYRVNLPIRPWGPWRLISHLLCLFNSPCLVSLLEFSVFELPHLTVAKPNDKVAAPLSGLTQTSSPTLEFCLTDSSLSFMSIPCVFRSLANASLLNFSSDLPNTLS